MASVRFKVIHCDECVDVYHPAPLLMTIGGPAECFRCGLTLEAIGDPMKTLYVEIRSGEGGNDSKLLVEDQVTLYQKFACRRRL
jgi:hypothetical protein